MNRPTPESTKFLLIGLALVVVGSVAVGYGVHRLRMFSEVAASGMGIPGKVVSRHYGKGFFLDVEYQPAADGASPLKKTFEVDGKFYLNTPIGAVVRVRHLPSNPEVAIIEGENRRDAMPNVIAGAFVILLGLLFMFIPMILAARVNSNGG